MSASILCSLAAGNEIPSAVLRKFAEDHKQALDSDAMVAALDKEYGALPSSQRDAFLIPKKRTQSASDAAFCNLDDDCVYFVGHSLGLQPRKTREYVNEELDSWAALGVNGHVEGKRSWVTIDDHVVDGTAQLVGAKKEEVTVMNSLTMNLHCLLISFYQPKGKRTRIMYEGAAFGSDYLAFQSQVQQRGLDPSTELLPLLPRQGEETLRTEDILKAIEDAGDTLATVCLGTVQYYTGQHFDMKAITDATHRVGAFQLWDLAHGVGNVDLHLHDLGVDGACWCCYKYLNSGPGAIAGFFVHEKHHGKGLPLLAGWWGNRLNTRFSMKHENNPEGGAYNWRVSNPPVLQTVSVLASLEIFGLATPQERRGRSMLLTGYLELLLQDNLMKDPANGLHIITPSDPKSRGSHLSLKFASEEKCNTAFANLGKRGVVTDVRKPNVIRIAPVALYNTFTDVLCFVRILEDSISNRGEPQHKAARTA